MRGVATLLALALGLALASCASAPPHLNLKGVRQELTVRTDPAGAACSVFHQGTLVASVGATPGTAAVPVDFRSGGLEGRNYHPPLESIPPMEVICEKEGFLEYRRTFAVEWQGVVSRLESGYREPSTGEAAAEAAAAIAVVGVLLVAPLAVVAVPAAAIPLTVAAGAGAIATQDAPQRSVYAYRTLPVFVLTPVTFDSEAACDAHFTTLRSGLQAEWKEEHARIDAECRFYPCKPSDPSPCRDPVCERLRTLADETLKSELSRIPVWREQVRITAP